MSSRVCVDASLIIATLVPDLHSERAAELVFYWLSNEIRLVAPALLAFEVTATLRRWVYLQQLNPDRGNSAVREFLRLPIALSARRDLFPLAWEMAKELRQPRAYDTTYLALARLSGCEFWTADERLYNTARDHFAWVRWVGCES